MVETHSVATRLERPPQEDTAAAADIEEAIRRAERKRCEDRLPGEGVNVVRAVDLPRLAAVRAPRDRLGDPVDPPFAESLQHLLA